MSVVVTPAESIHIAAIATLTAEMDRFYGATETESFKRRAQQIDDAIFGAAPSAHALLAWDGELAVAFATYSFLWPAIGLTRSLYLKELYVSESRRRAGIGKLLMRALFEVAITHNCSRVEWTTDRDNSDAQYFYKMIGMSQNPSKLFYRLEGEALRRAVDGK